MLYEVITNAVLLPEVLRFNLPAAPQRHAEVALALGIESNGSVEATAEQGRITSYNVCYTKLLRMQCWLWRERR